MYQDFRSLTLTGWHLEGTPLRIEQRQEELGDYYRHLFADEVQRQVQPTQPQAPTDLSDADLLARAMQARNGSRFARLWAGDTRDYDGDHSRADLALCGMLAFWCAGDAARVDRLFRLSGLYPQREEKWNRRHSASGATYGQMTVAKAIAGQSNALIGSRQRRSSS